MAAATVVLLVLGLVAWSVWPSGSGSAPDIAGPDGRTATSSPTTDVASGVEDATTPADEAASTPPENATETPAVETTATDRAAGGPTGSPTPTDEATVAAEPSGQPVAAATVDVASRALSTVRAELRAFPQAWPIVRGVYSTMWSFGGSRWNDLMDLVRTTEVNAIVIDVKDDAGYIAWKNSDVDLAHASGADGHAGMTKARAKQRIQELRAAGGYPIARIVCFKDPVVAPQNPTLAIHSAGGGVWRDRKGTAWLDANLKDNWDYLVDLGREAAELGFLEVQFDYVRFPTDGSTDATVYPRSSGVNPNAIRDFLRYSREQLHGEGVRISADIFGLTTYKAEGSGDGDGTGQLFEHIISQVDYVSPMVYPSHYYPGNYGLSNPEAHPYEVVVNAMREAQERVHGSRAKVRPWLEDFSLSVAHHPGRVSEQLKATYDNGIEGWLLWNAGNRYSVAALGPTETPKAGPSPIPPARQVASADPDAAGAAPDSPNDDSTSAPRGSQRLSDERLAKLNVNEVGRVLVMEWHEIKDEDGRWSNSLATFRRQLDTLYEQGYRPVTAEEFAAGRFPIPAGTSPVLLTFDDSYREHLYFGPDGDPHEDSVVGILEEFARTHDDWRATANFAFYWPAPFREPDAVAKKMRWLVDNGYELSNHSFNHDDLSKMDAGGVQESLAKAEVELREIVPDYRMRTLTLPFGQWPDNKDLAVTGSWNGHTYRHDLVFLVGFMPTRSPHHAEFNPREVQRVQAYLPEFEKWTTWMIERPHRRFVSDGDPDTVTYPEAFADAAQPLDGFKTRTFTDPDAASAG